jgi:hypothetical protein
LNVKEDYMSATQNQDLMTPEEAYDVLVAQVHAPVFFKKLASVYGVVPQNAKQARDLLQMAGQLRNVHEAETTKEAAAKGDMVSQAKHDLDHVLTQYGYPPLPDNDPTVKQAAWDMAGNAVLREAALVFQHHLSNAQR